MRHDSRADPPAAWITERGLPPELDAAAARVDAHRWHAELDRAHRLDAIGELAAGVAHNFNNLLGVITSAVVLLERHAAHCPTITEDVALVRAASMRAIELSNQLLAIGGRASPAEQALALSGAIDQLLTLATPDLGDDVHLQVSHAPDLWPALVDPSHLSQVLAHLIANACDAMPYGGALRLATTNVRLRDTQSEPGLEPGRYVELRVSDTGVGMAYELAARVFEPFVTTKPPGRGTGLGLPTVYGLMRRAGGRVALDSHPGAGTTVRVLWRAAGARDLGQVRSG
jgi:signal transduction histidine kinase